MTTTFHLLRHELRRLAPWITLHAALLIVSAVTLDHHDLARPRPTFFLLLDLALIGLVVLLIADLPMFGRRAFLKTRPFKTQELFSSRLLFLTLALWLPRVGAQLLALRGFGLLTDPVAKFLIADVALRQAVWIGTLFAFLSLCWQRWHWVVAAPVFAILGSEILTFAPQPPLTLASWQQRIGMLFFSVMLIVLVIAAFYRVRPKPAVLTFLTASAVSLFLLPTAPVEPASSAKTLAAPADPAFEIRTAPQPVHPLGPAATVLAVGLEPSGIDPTLGLRIRRVSSVLTSPRGLTYRGEFENLPYGCRYSEAWLSETVREATPPRSGRCGTMLQVPLFEIRPDWVELLGHLEGRLEIEVEVEVFRQHASVTEPRTGGALGADLDRLVVQTFEADSEARRNQRIDLLGFATESSTSPLATTTPGLDLLDTRRGRLVEFEEHDHLHDTTANLALRQPGLQLRTIEISIDETVFSGSDVPEDGLPLEIDDTAVEGTAVPDGGLPLELLLSDFRERSEPFTVTLEIDDFRAGDFVDKPAPHRSRSRQEHQP